MVKICSFADVHVRNYKRLSEYRKTFELFYESLKKQNPDFIVFCGDLAHTKLSISAEFVQVCTELLRELANISKTIIIPGNHDFSGLNSTRLDVITPVVEALNSDNIEYYKHSGIYNQIDYNLAFNHFSCFDEDWYLDPKYVNESLINIGLYHGFVQNAELQNGFWVDNCQFKIKDFLNVCDYMMLGDIHKHQILDRDFKSLYCGSLIAQNYSEDFEHGYYMWDIKSKTEHEVNFIEIPSIHPFYTLRLEDNLKIPDGLKYRREGRIRVFSRQLTVFEKDALGDELKTKFDPLELKFMDDASGHRQEICIDSVNAKVENLSDIDIQERLIKDFLINNIISDGVLQKIFEINRRYDAHFRKEDEALRNIQYKFGKLKWSNMFSYGEDNEFDFNKHKGTVGVLGNSGVGKSSLAVDTPLYCIFNKISKRVTKNDMIINENKDECNASIDIYVQGQSCQHYNISRKTDIYLKAGQKKGKPVYQGRTEVDFKLINDNGDSLSKNGIERSDTDAEIRKIFGTAEDFMATSVAPQFGLLNFIDMGGTERQKLIGRYFDIDIFDKKHKLAKEEFKETKAVLREFESRNIEDVIEKEKKGLLENENNLKKVKKERDGKDRERVEISKKIEDLYEKVVKIQTFAQSKEELESEIKRIKVKIINKLNEIDNIKNDVSKEENYISLINKDLTQIDYEGLKNELKELKDVKKDNMNIKLGACMNKIDTYNNKIEELKKYPCIKNKDCCMNTEVTLLSEKLLYKVKEKEELSKAVEIYNKKMDRLLEVEKIVLDYDEKTREVKNKKRFLETNQKRLKTEEELLEEFKNNIKEYHEKLDVLKDNEENIKKNEEIHEEIKELRFIKKRTDLEYERALREYSYISSNIKNIKCKIEELEKQEDKLEELKNEYNAYDYFIKTMSKDGISKLIIADNLVVINKEIKKILSHGINFDVFLESNKNGKEIEIYFKHEKSPKRSISLCSGMEKSIAALVIRVALINITTLPKSNVFILDEIFTAMDPEYMQATISILDYLKQLFDSVIIITHMEYPFRDIVDHVVVVERDENGYARISA